jgi:uncharacterized protein YndB with AHSA1/START domain
MSKLTLKTEGDRHVVGTRRFNALPEAVYRAHIEPDLIQQWMLGPEGWSMPVCINDPRPGGKFRYEWTNEERGGFHITGEFVELVPFSRIVISSVCTCRTRRRTITLSQRLKKAARGR